MNRIIIKYYFFKDLLTKLNNNLIIKFNYNNDDLFNYSSFIDLPSYYNFYKKSKPFFNKNVFNNDNDIFLSFIRELVLNIDRKNDFDNLLFIYGLLSSFILDKNLDKYYESNEIEDKNIIDNMLDYHLMKTNDNIDLSSNYLFKLFKNINYTNKMKQLVHYPFVKIYNQFGEVQFINNCYKKRKSFYKHYAIKNIFSPKFIFKNKKYKLKYRYIKYESIDEKLLSDLDYIINKSIYEVNEYIDTINLYLFENKDKDFRKLFKINDDYKF